MRLLTILWIYWLFLIRRCYCKLVSLLLKQIYLEKKPVQLSVRQTPFSQLRINGWNRNYNFISRNILKSPFLKLNWRSSFLLSPISFIVSKKLFSTPPPPNKALSDYGKYAFKLNFLSTSVGLLPIIPANVHLFPLYLWSRYVSEHVVIRLESHLDCSKTNWQTTINAVNACKCM